MPRRETPGAWTAVIRARQLPEKEERIGFRLGFHPLDGQPPQPEGVVVEDACGAGVETAP